MQISKMFSDDHTDLSKEKQQLSEIKRMLDSFSTEGNWQYNYSKIAPYIAKLKEYRYVKISSNVSLRNLYIELEKQADRLYNEYRSKVR